MIKDEEDLFEDFEKTREKKKVKKAPIEKGVVDIHIRINPRMIERGIFSAIIIALIALLVWNPFCGCSVTGTSGTASGGAVVVTDIEDVEETVEEDETEDIEEDETGDIEETTTATDEPIDASLSDLEFEKEGLKMTKVTLKLTNKGGLLNPKVVIHWYDSDSSSLMKKKIRAEWSYSSGISGDKVKSVVITSFVSKYLDFEANSGIIEAKLINPKNSEEIDSITKTISKS